MKIYTSILGFLIIVSCATAFAGAGIKKSPAEMTAAEKHKLNRIIASRYDEAISLYVKKYYKELGGVILGSRRYLFFERRLIHALSEQAERNNEGLPLDGSGKSQQREKEETTQNQTRSAGVGSPDPVRDGKPARFFADDPFNLCT